MSLITQWIILCKRVQGSVWECNSVPISRTEYASEEREQLSRYVPDVTDAELAANVQWADISPGVCK